ncbi:UxaA family hydrolase [Neptunicella sp. SCSIO 80796]|uniref:UxaA family hydrolase n=1 Tax=Neptunicella plasticusilytica TaxID=3117012 RepID=UPI003A4DD93D
MKGYLRPDGRKGIRNITLVCYLVECAHHVARKIVDGCNDTDVHLIGFPGCYPNDYALKQMQQLVGHPNVGAVLLLSLGCEGFNREALFTAAQQAGRPADIIVIQKTGGTIKSIEAGIQKVKSLQQQIPVQQVGLDVSELVIGTICGGSDGTSGITANPAVGRCFDLLLEHQATCIFEETGELIGCEQIMAERAVTAELGQEIEKAVHKAEQYYRTMGFGSFAPGNAEGGLTTQEEKSMGAYSKSGNSQISGLIKPGDIPPSGGLYLMDVVPDGEPRFGFPNISDNAEIVEMIASGAHLLLFTTGRGSVVGSAISPVIKICANPETYQNMADDMDINAGKILQGEASIEQVGEEIFALVKQVASGKLSCSEAYGHQEFILTYKQFEPIGPGCLPIRA